ncbi:MAG: carboxypeptidase-like regulatory domain-containing protein [Bacteroidetes bacterium]|nr:carboxypeptidase-like regulatory domain-containing protein [Bacteroidota bacterium]
MKGLLIWTFALLAILKLQGQTQEKLFSGDFKGFNFDRFVSKIESESNHKFYYDNRWTDTLEINFIADHLPLSNILEKILKGTSLHFAIDLQQRIYITHEREMMTTLPEDFFAERVANSAIESGFDLSDYENEQGKIRTAEQKVYTIGSRSAGTQGNATIAGYVTNQANGEPVTGASVYIEKPLIGTTTDQFGFFSLTIAKGKQKLKIQSLDMRPTYRDILLFEDGKLNIEVAPVFR